LNPRSRGAGEALSHANVLLLPLLRAASRLRSLFQAYARRPLRPVHVSSSSDNRIHVYVLEPPGQNPITIAVYVSIQKTRPAAPSQVLRRLERLRRVAATQSPPGADTVYVYLSTTRLTRSAYREARRRGVFVATKAAAAAGLLARLFAHRLRKLLEATGTRIWGPVALLAATLATLARELGADIDDETRQLLLSHALARSPR
jgi:hypothetical protein